MSVGYEHTALVRLFRTVLPHAVGVKLSNWDDIVKPQPLLAFTECMMSRAKSPQAQSLRSLVQGKSVGEASQLLVQSAVDAGTSFDKSVAAVQADLAGGNPLAFMWGLVELGMVKPLGFLGGATELLVFVKGELGPENDVAKLALLCYSKFQKRGPDEKKSLSDLRVALDFLGDLGLPRWTVDLASVARGSDKLLMLFAVFLHPILTGRPVEAVAAASAPVASAASGDAELIERLKRELLEARKADIERDELMQELDKTLSTAEASMQETQRVQMELEQLKQRSQAESEAWQEELKKALSSAEDALEQVLEANRETDQLRDQLEDHKTKANEEIGALKREVELLKKQKAEAADSHKVEEWKLRSERLVAENSELKLKLDRYKMVEERLQSLAEAENSIGEAERRLLREAEAVRQAAEADVQVAMELNRELVEELKLRDQERDVLLARLSEAEREGGVAKAELSNALACVEEAAQEAIAREAQLEKLEGSKAEADARCEQLRKELDENASEMNAVLASNVSLANEMVRLDGGLGKEVGALESKIAELESKNTALVAEIMKSERERAVLMGELENAMQMTQGLSARVESDEVERLKHEIQDMRVVMEGLQSAAEESTAQAEKYFQLFEARDVELSAVMATIQRSKQPPPDRMAAAIAKARAVLKEMPLDSFAGASLLETENLACVVLDALLMARNWAGVREQTAKLFASIESFASFVCNVAMWAASNSACCLFLWSIWTVGSSKHVSWLLWARSKMYVTLGIVASTNVDVENSAAFESLCRRAFGNLPSLAVDQLKWPLSVHTAALLVSSQIMTDAFEVVEVRENEFAEVEKEKMALLFKGMETERRLAVVDAENKQLLERAAGKEKEFAELEKEKMALLLKSMETERRLATVMTENEQLQERLADSEHELSKQVYEDDLVSAEEKRAQNFLEKSFVEEEGEALEPTRELLVYSDETVSIEEKRAVARSVIEASEEKRAMSSAVPASLPLFNVRKAAAKFSTLCLYVVLDTKPTNLLPSQSEAVSQFVVGYLKQLMQLHPLTSAESLADLKAFVIERLVLFLQKIRLAVVSGRRMNIDCKTWRPRAAAEDAMLAESDARLCGPHLKEFCNVILQN